MSCLNMSLLIATLNLTLLTVCLSRTRGQLQETFMGKFMSQFVGKGFHCGS